MWYATLSPSSSPEQCTIYTPSFEVIIRSRHLTIVKCNLCVLYISDNCHPIYQWHYISDISIWCLLSMPVIFSLLYLISPPVILSKKIKNKKELCHTKIINKSPFPPGLFLQLFRRFYCITRLWKSLFTRTHITFQPTVKSLLWHISDWFD